MTGLNDTTLVAYVDGELDATGLRAVEAALAGDAGARARTRELGECATLIRAAFGDLDEGSVPAWLSESIEQMAFADRPRQRRSFALPLAASLAAAAIGLGSGYLVGADRAQSDYRMARETDLLTEMASYYKVFASDPARVVELGADRTAYLESWFGRRLGREFTVPRLTKHGLAFRGGRFMAIEAQPAVLLVYEAPDGRMVGLCITKYWEKGGRDRMATRRAGMDMVFWARSGFAYALMGDVDPELLELVTPDLAHVLSDEGRI